MSNVTRLPVLKKHYNSAPVYDKYIVLKILRVMHSVSKELELWAQQEQEIGFIDRSSMW